MVTETRASSERLFYSQDTKEYNRYSDILTYKDTRVVLQSDLDTDYINACFIDSPFGSDRKLIAA